MLDRPPQLHTKVPTLQSLHLSARPRSRALKSPAQPSPAQSPARSSLQIIAARSSDYHFRRRKTSPPRSLRPPLQQPHHHRHAAYPSLQHLLSIKLGTNKVSRDWGMGIGVNHGEVIVGNIGSRGQMEPTVIGDAVNLASRLEALTRTYGLDMLVGASVAELVRDEVYLRSVAHVPVKGKTKPVDVFTLIAARGEETDPEFLKWLETYEEALEKFSHTRFYRREDPFFTFSGILSRRSAGQDVSAARAGIRTCSA